MWPSAHAEPLQLTISSMHLQQSSFIELLVDDVLSVYLGTWPLQLQGCKSCVSKLAMVFSVTQLHMFSDV